MYNMIFVFDKREILFDLQYQGFFIVCLNAYLKDEH